MSGIWVASRGYLAALALVALFTGLIALLRLPTEISNASMLYLIAVLAAAVLFGSGPAIVTAVGSFIAYNFFFIDPHYAFHVADSDEWLNLSLLLVSGLITGRLAAAMRDRAVQAERREHEAVLLYDTVRALTNTDLERSLDGIVQRLRSELDLDAVLLTIRDGSSGRQIAAGEPDGIDLARSVPGMLLKPADASNATPSRWIRVVAPGGPRGSVRGRDRVRAVPVSMSGTQVGALVVVRRSDARPFAGADERLLSALAGQIAGTLERIRLQREAVDAEVLRRTDELRKALLDAVSHDLRTPLSSIIASGGSLLQDDVQWTAEERRGFAEAIVGEGERLNHLVGNLLDLSRIEAGSLQPEKAWHDLPSLAQEVVGRAERLYPDRAFTVNVPTDMPPVLFDYVEIDEVLWNLVENAVRHGGGDITVAVALEGDSARVSVSDEGDGIDEAGVKQLFRPFGRGASRAPGSGLGLAVAHGFVVAHDGSIWAENGPAGGAVFTFTLPLSAQPAVAA